MQEAGLLSVVDLDGWEHHANGDVTIPLCNNPQSHQRLWIGAKTARIWLHVAGCYEPGGGNTQHQRVPGDRIRVSVNYNNGGGTSSY